MQEYGSYKDTVMMHIVIVHNIFITINRLVIILHCPTLLTISINSFYKKRPTKRRAKT